MGLSCFDGSGFVNYTDKQGLPSNNVQAIGEDCDGALYAGTSNGLAKFNGSRFSQVRLTADSSPPLTVYHLACTNDTLWISTSTGLFIKIGEIIKKVNIAYKTEKIIKSCYLQNSRMLLATNSGLLLYNGKVAEKAYLQGEYILDICAGKNGDYWLTTLSGDVYCWNNSMLKQLTSPDGQKLGATKIDCPGNEVWLARRNIISVYKNGAYAYDIKGLDAGRNNFITDFITDCEGNHWISSNDGLLKLRSTSLVKYKFNSNQDASVYSINNVPSEALPIVGGSMQLFRINADSLKPIKTKPGKVLVSDINFITEAPGGGLLIGESMGGLGLLKDGHLKKYDTSDGIQTLRMFCYTKMPNGDVWVGSNNALYHISILGIKSYGIPGPGSRNILSLLAIEGEDVFMAGTARGLFIFRDNYFEEVKEIPELREAVISSLSTDGQGRIILGVKGKGIFIIRFTKNKPEVINKVNSLNGLGSDFVLNAVTDKYNQLWTLTGNGIYRVQSYLSLHPVVVYIGREEGMPDNSWGEGAIYADKIGRVFIGGSRGLVSLDGNTRFGNIDNLLKPHFKKIISGRNGLDLIADSLLWNNTHPSVEIDYENNSFSVHFNCVALSYPGQLKFSVYMEGYDVGWSANNPARFVNYNNLPPGEYKLHLKAIVQNSNREAASTVLLIRIRAPFWMTLWFRLIMMTTFVFILFLVFRRRRDVQRLRHEKELETNRKISESRFIAFQARMNPHFIFNCLNAIQYFIVSNDKESTLNYLSKFARLLRQILDSSIDSSITVESELQIIRSYLEMESMRFDNKFEYTIETGVGFDPASTEIPGMILQPFVENAIIHGLLHKEGKGHLNIRLEKSVTTIICYIRDDGIGRERSEIQNSKRSPNHRSHGMSIALKRLELLAGNKQGEDKIIEIKDVNREAFDTGTEVIIRLPII